MARRKRSNLPQVEFQNASRDDVRPTPNGGWAWKCHYCGQYASSETLDGIYVCRRHGGVTPRQRDPLLILRTLDRTGKRPRPPGRPMIHGRRSRSERVNVADAVRNYMERQSVIGEDLRERIRRSLAGQS